MYLTDSSTRIKIKHKKGERSDILRRSVSDIGEE